MRHQRAPFRLLRTATVAAAVLCLAAWAHILAGGRLPPAPVTAACTALVVLGVVLVSRWKLTAPAMTGILAVGQGMLHIAFSALSGPVQPMAEPARHSHRTAAAGELATSSGTGLHRHLQNDFDLPMLGTHIAATLLTAALLAKGEEALWALATWLRPLAGPPEVRVLFMAPQTVPVPRRALARRWRIMRRQPLRGPPAALCI